MGEPLFLLLQPYHTPDPRHEESLASCPSSLKFGLLHSLAPPPITDKMRKSPAPTQPRKKAKKTTLGAAVGIGWTSQF